MASEVKMPRLGMTMEEGTILKWLYKEGDAVKQGDALLEVETDKATLEAEAPVDGILLKILHKEGAVVPVLQNIGIIGTPGEDISHLLEGSVPASAASSAEEGKKPESTAAAPVFADTSKVRSTPAAKFAAIQKGIDINTVNSNNYGVVTKKEIDTYRDEPKIKVTPVANKIAQANNIRLEDIVPEGRKIFKADVLSKIKELNKTRQGAESRVRLSGIRRVIAERMQNTWQTVPMVTNNIEVDVSNSLELCKKINEKFAADGIKVNITDLMIKILAAAVRQNPAINVCLDGNEIVYRDDVNIGLAVSIDNGLIVPVIKNADLKSLSQINAEKKDLVDRARNGKVGSEETSGGSITFTNMGAFCAQVFTPIINPPESCIVGIGKIIQKAVVVNNEIVIRPMVWLNLTYDHRVLDGVPIAMFLDDIRSMIEQPGLLVY